MHQDDRNAVDRPTCPIGDLERRCTDGQRSLVQAAAPVAANVRRSATASGGLDGQPKGPIQDRGEPLDLVGEPLPRGRPPSANQSTATRSSVSAHVPDTTPPSITTFAPRLTSARRAWRNDVRVGRARTENPLVVGRGGGGSQSSVRSRPGPRDARARRMRTLPRCPPAASRSPKPAIQAWIRLRPAPRPSPSQYCTWSGVAGPYARKYASTRTRSSLVEVRHPGPARVAVEALERRPSVLRGPEAQVSLPGECLQQRPGVPVEDERQMPELRPSGDRRAKLFERQRPVGQRLADRFTKARPVGWRQAVVALPARAAPTSDWLLARQGRRRRPRASSGAWRRETRTS